MASSFFRAPVSAKTLPYDRGGGSGGDRTRGHRLRDHGWRGGRVAGLALLTSLAGALANALASEEERLPAILTFVTAASGITIIGIGAAFWGLVAGIVLLLLLRWRARKPA